LFLHIEERRFKREWTNDVAYTSWKGLREPAEHVPSKWLRNVAKAYRLGQFGWRYPAEKRYPTLPTVLTNLRDSDWESRSNQCFRLWKGVMGVPIDGH
jgi:hypothetical protein